MYISKATKNAKLANTLSATGNTFNVTNNGNLWNTYCT